AQVQTEFLLGRRRGVLLEPGAAVVLEWSAVGRYRHRVAVLERGGQAQRVLDLQRLAFVDERRSVEVEIEVAAEIAADRRNLRVRETARIHEPARRGLPFDAVRDPFLDRVRSGGRCRGGSCLEERTVDVLVDNRAFDGAGRAEWTFGHVPLE